jgi:hypothetical protein
VLIGRELIEATNVEHLTAGALLPPLVHVQEHGGPGQGDRRRLLAGEEEIIAFF